MAELVIRVPGQPEQVLPLGAEPISIGRGEQCTAFIAEKKASRRHLTVRRTADGAVVAEDHESSNGTLFVGSQGDERFARRLLDVGDVLRIGDTVIELRGATGGTAAVPAFVSGTLQLRPADPGQGPPQLDAPPPAGAVVEPSTPSARAPEEARGTRGSPRRSLLRGIAVCAAALGLLAGVELYLGVRADRAAARKEAHLEALRVLEHVGEGSQAFRKRRDAFASEHPNAAELLTLDRYLERIEEREAFVRSKRDALNNLQGQMHLADRSEVRVRLLQLMRELPDEREYVGEIERILRGLDGLRAEEDLEALRALEGRVQMLRGEGDLARAGRLVEAFGESHVGMGTEVAERWTSLRAALRGALAARAGDLWTRLEAEQDAVQRRRLLASAWPALAGTPDGRRIAERLRSAASLAAPRAPSTNVPSEPGSARPPTAPSVPTVAETLLARARAAEQMLARREWSAGREALARLAEETEGGRLQAEWRQRLSEVEQVLALVRDLAADAAARQPRCKLSSGSWTILEANAAQVKLESKRHGIALHEWKDMPARDVLVLLTPRRPSPAQRHAVAILAGGLGERDAFVQALLPLYEKGGDLAATDAIVARHLYGRSAPPEGGYRAYKGDLLDRSGYERKLTQERIGILQGEADRLLSQVAKESVFRKLARLKAMREELDKRRTYALQAIFNTTHYPYPYRKGSQNYRAVQEEIDRRTASVREIWDDPLRVVVKRSGRLQKLLDAWDETVAELISKDVDVSELQSRIAPFAIYVTGEPLGIRDYFRDAAERELLAYNRWVMQQYNPARIEVARESESKQVEVTNEYRMMIGFTAVVTPGPAPYASITKDNVIQILDQAKVEKLSPLRAVRIDNRLVTSARLHSEDMSRRGYFAHQAPPDPATGAGPTGPADRMMRQHYRGWGYSENIAMSGSPTQAHMMWIHSSGHHRNILSGWTDLGSGVGGRNFTQNFASGGGARPETQPDTSIRDRAGPSRGGERPRRGQ